MFIQRECMVVSEDIYTKLECTLEDEYLPNWKNLHNEVMTDLLMHGVCRFKRVIAHVWVTGMHDAAFPIRVEVDNYHIEKHSKVWSLDPLPLLMYASLSDFSYWFPWCK